MEICENRLTVIGAPSTLARFDRTAELATVGGRFEILEHSKNRRSWRFESDQFPLQGLDRISRDWPTLTFLLDSDNGTRRIKLLAKMAGENVQKFAVRY